MAERVIRKIGVLTSGGDSPGMNAAIRAVVRAGISNDLEVYGIHDGYRGLYENKIERLYRKSVSEKVNRGGTFLGTERLPEFKYEEVRQVAIERLNEYGIDALVCIGGDGTFNEVVTGNMQRKKRLLVANIPIGTTNDVGAMFGYGKNFSNNLKLLMEGSVKNIDICVVNGRPFIYVAGLGKFINIAAPEFYRVPVEDLMSKMRVNFAMINTSTNGTFNEIDKEMGNIIPGGSVTSAEKDIEQRLQ